MDMSGMHAAAAGGADAAGLVLRLLLLSGTAVVAGLGLLRGVVPAAGRAAAVLAWSGAAVAAAASLLSIPLLDVSAPVAVVHAVLAVAVPVLLNRPPATYLGSALGVLLVVESALGGTPAEFLATAVATAVVVVWLGLAGLGWTAPAGTGHARRLRLLALVLAALLVVAAALRAVATGIADRRLVSPLGLDLLVLVLAAGTAAVIAVALRSGDPWRIYRGGAVAVAVAFLALAVLPALPRPGELPVPGVARLAHTPLGGAEVPVLVTPHRPGPNLVHLPDSAGSGITVRAGGRPVELVRRPGASGTWARVELPAGRGELVLRRGSAEGSVEVDTGTRPAPAGAAGADGPECAGAALAGLVAGRRDELTGCPAEELRPEDAAALRVLVGYVHRRGAAGISLIGDGSPRSRDADAVVRDAAARAGLPVSPRPQAENALVLVSGWQRAAEVLGTRPPGDYGVHLAPWLMQHAITDRAAGSAAPLRFDPRDEQALTYGMALDQAFPGEAPCPAGFRRWQAAHGQRLDGPLVVYAAAQVDVMQMTMPGMPGTMPMHGSEPAGQWVPRGTVVPASEPLAP